MKCYVLHYTKLIENIIIITLYTFRLNSVFTTDICFSYILPLMLFIFYMQGERSRNISKNYIIKTDVCIKLKYIKISLDMYQHIILSYRIKKKEEINAFTMKTLQIRNKWD